MSELVRTVFKVPLDTLQFIRKNTLLTILFFSAAMVGIGLVNNYNPGNTLQPVGYDTTSIQYFSNEQIKQMWEEWRLNAQASADPVWAGNHQFNYVAYQQTVGGNQLKSTDPIFGNGAGGFNKAITALGSGLYVVVVSTNETSPGSSFALLFQVVSVVNSNLNPSVPSNQITYPNTYKLSYIDYVNNSANYY